MNAGVEETVRQDGVDFPLEGVRVLDLSRVFAGPLCGQVLADFGAEVVKVIAPGSRDSYDPIPFYLNNASKKSVELDLKSEFGLQTALRLADKADILVENFSPGVIDRLGLGWDVLSARNPRLIYAQLKGFAEDSPYRDFPCFDPVAQGFAGGSSITGEPDGLPMKPGPDVGSAMRFLLELRLDEGPLGAEEAERRLRDWWAAR